MTQQPENQLNMLFRKAIFSFVLTNVLLVFWAWPQQQTKAQVADTTQNQITSFSLAEAQKYALINQGNAKNARLNIENAKKQANEYTSIGLPQINANINYQRYLKLPAQLVPGEAFGMPEQEFVELVFGTDNNLTAGIEFSQMIARGDYFVGLKAAKALVELRTKEAEQSHIEVQDAVAKAYLAALVADESLEIVEKNVTVIEKILFETQQLYENGFAEEIAVDRLRLSLSNLKTQLASLQRQKELGRALLKFQMGYSQDEPIVLSNTLDDFLTTAQAFDLEMEGKTRIELLVLETQRQLNRLDIQQTRAKYFPSLTVFGAWQTSFQGNNFDNFSDWSRWIKSSYVGVRMNIPIYDGSLKRAQVQQKKINDRLIVNGREMLEQSISLEKTQAKTEYLNALEQINNQQQNVELAQKIYNTTLIKYREGLGSSLELTDAETKLYETQSLYIQALYDLAISKTSLDKALGNYENN